MQILRVDFMISSSFNFKVSATLTIYAGGLMAFELTEINSSYAMALVCKHFSNNSTPPGFPYVKVCNTTIVNK